MTPSKASLCNVVRRPGWQQDQKDINRPQTQRSSLSELGLGGLPNILKEQVAQKKKLEFSPKKLFYAVLFMRIFFLCNSQGDSLKTNLAIVFFWKNEPELLCGM